MPFCVVAVAAAVVMAVTRGRLTGPAEDGVRHDAPMIRAVRAGWVLWGGWLVLCWAVFSFAERIFHPYYTTQLSPAVAAPSGAGAVTMWRLYLRPVGAAWALLPVAVGMTALWAFVLVRRTPEWVVWLAPLIATAGTLPGRQQSVLDHVTANRDGARILLATLSATGAAPYIIATGEDVIAMGGYNATDQAVTLEELGRLVEEGDLRFVQLSGFTGQGADADPGSPGSRRAGVQLDGVIDLYRCDT